jgi:hypothetical protein
VSPPFSFTLPSVPLVCHGSLPFCGCHFPEKGLSAVSTTLKQARPGQSGAVGAQIIAEPDIIAAWHLSSSCPASCQQARYWCGFVEFRMLRQNKRCTLRKEIDLPDPDYFFLNSRTGLARSWLRRWRYRMYLHRASFQGEGILLRLLNAAVRYHIRH